MGPNPRIAGVMSLLIPGGLSCRDKTNDIAALADAVADHENAQFGAHAEWKQSVFPLRMLGVIELDGLWIEEHGAGLFEGNAVFPGLPENLQIGREDDGFLRAFYADELVSL